MGIRFNCPNGHKLNVKEFLAGKRGVCPQCGAKFVIPTPAASMASQAELPLGVGQAPSVEIPVLPPASQAPAAIASPSIIIPSAEVELELADPIATPARGPELLPSSALPASILPGPAPEVPGSAAVAADVVIASPRERSRRNQMIISFMLLALVIFLAVVLVWVLKRERAAAIDEKVSAVSRVEYISTLAMTGNGFLDSERKSAGASVQ